MNVTRQVADYPFAAKWRMWTMHPYSVERTVEVMGELFTLLKRGRTGYLTDRYSERNEPAPKPIDRQTEKL